MASVVNEFIEHRITVAISLPTWINLLFTTLGDRQLPHVKYIGCGGDVISQALPEKVLSLSPEATFFNFYGPTECTVTSLCYKYPTKQSYNQIAFYSVKYDKTKADGCALPIGSPILNTKVYPWNVIWPDYL